MGQRRELRSEEFIDPDGNADRSGGGSGEGGEKALQYADHLKTQPNLCVK